VFTVSFVSGKSNLTLVYRPSIRLEADSLENSTKVTLLMSIYTSAVPLPSILSLANALATFSPLDRNWRENA